MKVLIVEDDTPKLAKITAVLRECGITPEEDVEYTIDINSARGQLLQTRFDLLVLDIALPTAIDGEVRSDAGLDLLTEVLDREQYKVPRHIIGLTGNQTALEAARGKFDDTMFTLAWYNPMSDEWAERLRRRVRHMLASEAAAAREVPAYECALVLICALDEELEAIRRIKEWNWQYFERPGDTSVYYQGSIQKNGYTHSIYAAAASRMGMPATAALAMKMVQHFRPRHLGMAGVTAGVKGEVKTGDIVVADPSWDGGSGKWVSNNGRPKFLPHPQQIPLAPELLSRFRRMRDNNEVLEYIRRSAYPAVTPDHALRIHIGPVASGAAVLSHGGTAARLKDQNRKLIGIEMETYGLYLAAMEAPEPRPTAFSMKSVVDFADEHKDDRYRAYSLFTSAQALRVFVEDYLL
jgi:nucleoside phosphorylase/CheY-like chemotaxis protein